MDMSRCWLRCRAMLSTLDTGASMAKRRRGPPNLGQAINYRFKRDARGWRVFVTTRMMDVPVVTDQRRGALGVDLNADHLAVAETDASGNCLNAWRVPLVPYGKSTHQAEALLGDGVASVVEYARDVWEAHRHRESWTFVRRRLSWKVHVPQVQPDAVELQPTARSRLISCPVAIVREWRYIRSTRPTVR